MKTEPQYLLKNGKKAFAVIPYDDYLEMRERIEDLGDLLLLREAREDDPDAPLIPLDRVLAELHSPRKSTQKKTSKKRAATNA